MEKKRPTIEVLERACRVYKKAQDAGRALECVGGTFNRWCKEAGIETIYTRQQRLNRGTKG